MKTVHMVSGVLGIVLSVGWLYATAETRHSGTTEINMKMAKLKDALEIYSGKHDLEFPASLDELARFAYKHLDLGKPLLKEGDLIDTWGEPIAYETDGRHWFIIRSSGPDKVMGTADDSIRGYPPAHVDEARRKARETPAVVRQETGIVQRAAGETPRPPAVTPQSAETSRPAVAPTKPPERAPLPSTQHDDENAGTKNVPWKMSLLLGVIIIGAVSAWRCFRKKE